MRMMARKVPFLDLRVRDEARRRELLEAVDHVLQHGRIILGPEVQELESRVAAYCRRSYGVAVGSGTDALHVALKALNLSPGDEVITTPLSAVATANAIALAGATPVFVDVADDLNIDPGEIEGAITPRTRAILPVHFAGKLCRMDAILAIAREHGLLVIEDGSQAFGARSGGRAAGGFGIVACFSMNPMKSLAACGEAGMIVTDREDLYRRMGALRYNGMINREVSAELSLNCRMDTLQAAILLRRLEHVEELIGRRRRNAARYSRCLERLVDVPHEAEEARDVYYAYLIRSERRDALKAHLEARGIEAQVCERYLTVDQPVYREAAAGTCPRARDLVRRLVSLPVHEDLSDEDLEHVGAAVAEFCAGSA